MQIVFPPDSKNPEAPSRLRGVLSRTVHALSLRQFSVIAACTAVLTFGLICLSTSFQTPDARADYLSELGNSGEAQDSNLADDTDPCLKNLPIPAPAQGLHRVIQMVTCSNQTILGAADAAGRAPVLLSEFFRGKRRGRWDLYRAKRSNDRCATGLGAPGPSIAVP